MSTFIQRVRHIRNIGISAHVDAGKTTLTERMLYYAGRIHRMAEVHDREGRGTAMDTTASERRHGITVHSAATYLSWREHHVSIIDTPGHADFTLEVERALAVLDGAVFVFSGVEGVQAQSVVVDGQMRKHGVPRIGFINKMDRAGADLDRVAAEIESTLAVETLVLQRPVFVDGRLVAVADLLLESVIAFEGEKGSELRRVRGLDAEQREHRKRLLEQLAGHDESLLESLVAGEMPSRERITSLIRELVRSGFVMPLLVGSALSNIGVQPLLDAVVDYLPHPGEVARHARDVDGRSLRLEPDPSGALAAFVFKTSETRFGRTAFARIYRGELHSGSSCVLGLEGPRLRVGRILRIHAASTEEVSSAQAGDIVGLFGLDADSGQTLCSPELRVELPGFEVPEPLVTRSVEAKDARQRELMHRALHRMTREDPSLRVRQDEETGETLLSGIGILHLSIVAERLMDEEKLEVRLGKPEVAYREVPSIEVAFEHLHRKQSGGGAGQYAGVTGTLSPRSAGEESLEIHENEFTHAISGGAIPKEYLSGCAHGVDDALAAGPLIGAPVVGVHVHLVDGRTHTKDSSDLAFRIATRDAVNEALRQSHLALLEPWVELEIEAPSDRQGAVLGVVGRRAGQVRDSEDLGHRCRIRVELPLSETFTISDELGSASGGRASHTMKPAGLRRVPAERQAQIVARLRRS